MNITLTIEAPELVGALNNLANAFGNANPLEGVQINKPLETQVPEEAPAPKKETPKPEKKAQAKPKAEPKPEPTPEPEPEPETVEPEPEPTEEPESTPSISLDTLTTKTRKFVQGNPENRKKLKGFLEEMGVPKISELPPAEYAAAIEFMESNGE